MPPTPRHLLLATVLSLAAAFPASASAAPDLLPGDIEVTDGGVAGHGIKDGILGPGDTVKVTPSFYVGETDFAGGNGALSGPSSSVNITNYLQAYPAAARHTLLHPAGPSTVTLGSNFQCGARVPLALTMSGNDGSGSYKLPISTGVAGPSKHFVSEDIGDSILDSSFIESDLPVTGDGRVKNLKITIGALNHVYGLRWYEIVLVSPSGTRVKLFTRGGTGADSQRTFQNVTFSDDASTSSSQPTELHDVSVLPDDSLSVLDGEPAAGKWTLEVRDINDGLTNRRGTRGRIAQGRSTAGQVVGQLDDWSLDVATGVCSTDPIAWFTPEPLVLDPAGGTVLDASASVDPGLNDAGTAPGAITKYEWDLDGSADSFEYNGNASPTVAFPATPKGKRIINLRVTDNNGHIGTVAREALITKVPVISAITATPADPEAKQLVSLQATANDPDGSIVSVAWDFDGDGIFEVTGTSPTTNYTWTSSGAKVVRVKVTDDTGATKVKATTITVANKPPIAKLTADQSPGHRRCPSLK